VIDVYLEKHDSMAEIRIEDSGPGIPEQFLPHIFERFSQSDGSITRKHGGLGLGLAIVRHLVELHGGTVSASNGKKGGAVLAVQLPSSSQDYRITHDLHVNPDHLINPVK
jgi:signal transduction histidine kinase